MRLLITGFEAFAGSSINPSELVVLALKTNPPPDINFFTAVLPVDAHSAPAVLAENLASVSPQVVICLGEASGRSVISIERAALNLLDFRIADNLGNQINDQQVISGAPTAYFSTLPVRRMLEMLLENGIPAELSLSAGAYLCNQVFFHLMHWASQQAEPIAAGFIHLPSFPEQVAMRSNHSPSMALDTSLKAVRLVINQLCTRYKVESNEAVHD